MKPERLSHPVRPLRDVEPAFRMIGDIHDVVEDGVQTVGVFQKRIEIDHISLLDAVRNEDEQTSNLLGRCDL